MIHCIGDSHVFVFTGVDSIGARDILPLFKTYRLGPHTAYNVMHQRSRIEQIIENEVRPGDRIMFCFGEIDCRSHLLKQSELQRKPLDAVVRHCVDRYFEIFKMAKQYGFPLLAWNAPASSREDVAYGEYSTYGTCKQRNEVTRLFNEFLQKRCEENGVLFLSVFDKLVDEDGLTNPFYYMDNIHLSQKAMPLIWEELGKTGVTQATVSPASDANTVAKESHRIHSGVIMNIVYASLTPDLVRNVHRGNVSVINSSSPLEGCDVYAYVNADSFRGPQGGVSVLLMFEPLVVLPGVYNETIWRHFDHVFTWCDALTKRGGRFTKMLLPRSGWHTDATITEDLQERDQRYPVTDRKNAICMINGNKQSFIVGELYSKRVEAAIWFHLHSDMPFDVFGTPPFPLPNYKGALALDAKLSTLSRYRYCLCFENTNHSTFSAGYISEKILDCLETRTIPIYFGCSNVDEYVPRECFIDFRNFRSYAELNHFLHTMDAERYNRYIDRIDAWVADGGLRPYSWSTIHDQLAALVPDLVGPSADPSASCPSGWQPGLSPSCQDRKWVKVSSAPIWSWQFLAGGTSPLIEEACPIDVACPETDRSGPAIEQPGSFVLKLQDMKSPSGSLRPTFLRNLSRVFDLQLFIETGTYRGDTSSAASRVFESVHTIELSPDLYRNAVERFEHQPNVHVYHGDSTRVFPQILGGMKGNILFWLDGHYSEGCTAKGDENTPIIQELKAIKDAHVKGAVILIDDLRMFDKIWDHIPDNSGARDYPSARSVVDAIRDIDASYRIAVLGDVLMAYPPRDSFDVSPVVASCTISRLFDGSNYDLREVLDAETTIMRASGEELSVVSSICMHFKSSESLGFCSHFRLWYALTLIGQKNYARACVDLLIAMNLGFEHWRIHWYLAQAAFEAGYFSLADKSVKTVLHAVPEYEDALSLQVRVRQAQMEGRHEYKFSTRDRLELAAHLQSARKYSEAIDEMKSALEEGAQSIDVYLLYAELLVAAGQPEAAIDQLNQSLQLNQNATLIHNELGVIYFRGGDFGRAWEHMSAAVSLDRKNYTAIRNLLTLLIDVGDYQEAARTLKSLMDSDPEDRELVAIAEQSLSMIKHAVAVTRPDAVKEAPEPPSNPTDLKQLSAEYYNTMIGHYPADSARTDRFVHPVWKSQLATLGSLILSGLPDNFLLHPICREMFVRAGWRPPQEHEIAYLEKLGKKLRKKIFSLPESPIGGLPLDCKNHPISVNTLGMLWYFARIHEHLTTAPTSIIEFGGGFGSLARVFKSLSKPGLTYTIIDLPEMLALQYYYLTGTLGRDAVVAHIRSDEKTVAGKINLFPVYGIDSLELSADLFVSTFALSETPEFMQKLVSCTKNFFHAPFLYITGQNETERKELGWQPPHTIVQSVQNSRVEVTNNRFHIGDNYELMASGFKKHNGQQPFPAAAATTTTPGPADTRPDGSSARPAAQSDKALVSVIFSKDRAMQLDGTLRSLFLHCTDADQMAIKVLYTTSSPRHEGQYGKLKREYPSVEFIRETSFRNDLLAALSPFEYVLFLVDDNVFVRGFTITRAVAHLGQLPHAIGYSLRLGKNTDYCYMLNQPQALPKFDPRGDGVLCYDWTLSHLDFGYPLEVSSSLYRLRDLLPLLNQIEFKNPNTLELMLDSNKGLYRDKRSHLLCFEQSVAFCNPLNMVQTMWANRAGNKHTHTPETLSRMFEEGLRIDIHAVSGITPNACHQEIEFSFVPLVNPLQTDALSQPLVSIVILHQNGLDHLRLNLESIRRNTPEPHEIIIFDNASSDGSREYLRSLSDIILIESPENIGCTPGRAKAMSAARGEYLVLLDNDTVVTKGWVTKFIEHAKKNPHIGIMGPCSNYVSGPQLVPNASYKTESQLEIFAEEWSRQHPDELVPVSRLVGFCMFIRKELFEKIGIVDEKLGFFGFDDDDYSLRAYIAGFNPSIARDIFIHHTGGPQGRGDQQVNRALLEAWECYKRKWGIDQALPCGIPYDVAPIRAQAFDPLKHYCRPYPASVIEKMTYSRPSITQKDSIGPPIVDVMETHSEEPSSRAQKYFEEGNEWIKKGDFERAVKAFQAAIHLSPLNASGCYLNMGYALKQQGNIDGAIRCYENALSLQPGYVDAYCNLGNAYKEKDEPDRAIGYYEKALELNPTDADSLYNLGNIYREQGKFDEAVEHYQKALKTKKDHLGAHSNLCVALKEKGDLKEAEKRCRKLIKMAPEYPEARWNLALIHLLAGKLRDGWEGYEWRWRKPDYAAARRGFPRPLWTGFDIQGKTILIHAEQGYGDTIQFIRYAPMLAARGARVIVECQPALKSLMATVEGVSEVFTRGGSLPDFDVHCPIMSLPRAFATAPHTIPAKIPYIAADLSVFNKWKERIRDKRHAHLKVGIAWAGSPAHKNDKNRSCPFEQLLPLFSLKHVTFYSLQKNDGRQPPAANTEIDNLNDHTGEIHDFLDTAGFIQNLDVVISVDSAVAHLAGALGQEVWTLLPFAPEWRWMLKREDSPWYPTMKLFRQEQFGDWQGVIEKVKAEMESRLAPMVGNKEKASRMISRVDDRSKSPIVPGMASIIIHGLSNLKNLKVCLERLKNNAPGPFEVIIADNNCPAETRKWLHQWAKTAKNYQYEASSNPGLAHAINRGISASSGEHIVLLSSDAMVSEHWLSDLLSCLNRTPGAGIVGPMMNAAQGKQRVAHPDDKNLEQLSAFAGIFREHYRHRRISSRTVSGYCMIFRRDLVDHIGSFDDNPFFGRYTFEDYCFRAQMEGRTNTLCGDVYVHVSRGAESPEDGSRKAFQEKWSAVDKQNELAEKIGCLKQMEEADRLILQGRTDQAIDTLIRSIGHLPGAKDLYYMLAELLLENKRYPDAIGAVKAMSSDDIDVRKDEIIGTCKEGLGLDDEAERSADRALSLMRSARAYNLKGVLAFKKGNLENAEAHFKKAMDCDPGYGEPYTNTGVLKWSEGRKHEGLEWMEKGFILSPQINDASERYYSALMDLGQYERGERILRETINAYPAKKIIFLFIDSLLKQDKFKEAMAEAENAILSFGLEEGMLEAALEIRSKIGPKTVDQSAARPSLSLCMIVKDEEQSLAKCLGSIKEIVDEMIVVDTGSHDQTKEIALAYGAKLYHYEWTNSFADARNYSLDQAQGDWVLLLDADEVISDLDHDAILDLIRRNRKTSAYSITTRNYLDQVSVEGWTPNDDRYYREAAGCGWMPSEKVRIFPNRKGIRFENPVHEFVESSLARAGIEVHRCAVPIHHYGKLNHEKMQAKEEKYYQLGIKKLEEKGNDLKSLIEIAIQAAEAGKYDDALMWWQKVIEINPDEAVAYYNMGSVYLYLKRYAEAIEVTKRSLEISPDRKEAVTNLALGEMIGGDNRNAIRVLERLINDKVEYPLVTGLLAIAYCVDGRADSGLKQLSNLKKMNFRFTPFVLDTAQRMADAGRNAAVIKLLEALIEGGFADYELVNYHAECMNRYRQTCMANMDEAAPLASQMETTPPGLPIYSD